MVSCGEHRRSNAKLARLPEASIAGRNTRRRIFDMCVVSNVVVRRTYGISDFRHDFLATSLTRSNYKVPFYIRLCFMFGWISVILLFGKWPFEMDRQTL